MSNLHLKQTAFPDSACEPFTKRRERIQKFREAGYLKHLNRNELDKATKGKKGKTVLLTFIKTANESNCMLNKLWVDQGRELYNKFMQEWFDNNDILMYSSHNKDKSVIAERFIKTLKVKINKKW